MRETHVVHGLRTVLEHLGELPRRLFTQTDMEDGAPLPAADEQRRVRELAIEHAAREQAEAAHGQIDAILRHLPVGVVVVEAPSGRMVTYNPEVERLFGYPPPMADSLEEYPDLYHANHLDGRRYTAEEWPIWRAVRGGAVVAGEDMEFVRWDGSRRVFRVGSAPVRDADERIVGGVLTLEDVTRARRAGEMRAFLGRVSDLLGSSLDYETTVQRVAEMATQVLAEFCIVYVNEYDRIRGLGVAHVDPQRLGVLREMLRRYPLAPDSEDPVAVALRTGETQLVQRLDASMLDRLARNDAHRSMIRELAPGAMLAVPIRTAGRVLGAVGLVRSGARGFDELELEIAEELAGRAGQAVDNARLYREARSAARARDEILSVVSHDLRNSIHAALMNTDMLLELTPAFSGDTMERRQIDGVRRSLQHMHRLVQDLLEVDRMERGRLSMAPDAVRPAVLAEEVWQLFEGTAREGGVELVIEVPHDLPPVWADHARMVQVISNLLSNAIRHTPAGGTVRLGAAREAGDVVFFVDDTGEGIAEAELPRVFERFYQAGPTRGEGSGLGLPIARGLVEAHGGRMWATSRLGQGSTFRFSVPIARQPG